MRPTAGPDELRPYSLPVVASVRATEGSPPVAGLCSDQLTLERAGLPMETARHGGWDVPPGYTPAPTPWELGERLRRIEATLDRLLSLTAEPRRGR